MEKATPSGSCETCAWHEKAARILRIAARGQEDDATRDVAADFLIDAGLTCPGVTRPTMLGLPLRAVCGMPDERQEQLKHLR